MSDVATRSTRAASALPTLQADLLADLKVGGDRELLRRVTVALGEARDQGHVCLDLSAWCECAPDADEPARPALAQLREQLLATGLVAQPDVGDAEADRASAAAASLPLVLDDQHRLYALRHHRAERRIAAFLRARLAEPARTTPTALRESLVALDLLPPAGTQQVDWQLTAVCAAAWQSVTVICGGPGTGKTTTVARLLAVLLQQEPELRIAISAPTGKAAARLGEALQERAASQPGNHAALQAIEPRTLHRLLGYLPLDDGFRYGRDRQLPFDLVVVDEVSMVDPAILLQLCEALPRHSRLILVGDKDQLAAVAAGQVLGDVCHSARPERGVGARLAAFVADATGMQVPSQADGAPIADATVALWHNHRFGQQPGIGAFAQALMQRQPDAALAALQAGHADLCCEPDAQRALQRIEPHLLALYAAAAGGDAETALQAIGTARVLTAQRLGPTGAVEWNRRVEALLRQRSHRVDDPFYVGRPILVTSNDHGARIWNGDLGVTGRDRQGNAVVWFRDGKGKVRALHPHRLPAHETAWAITVHKAQGSEFDHVLLVLPDRAGPMWHAALIYTGVTRARQTAIVSADPDLLAAGLGNWPQRTSGLADALRE